MEFTGKVIKGHQVGGKFGIATANLEVIEELDLEEGVYLVEVGVEDGEGESEKQEGLLHYGQRKTFGSEFSAEVHLLNFDQNLYSKNLVVHVLKFLRRIQKFQNADSLFTQIEQDIVQAQKYFLRRRVQEMWRTIREEERQALSVKAIEKVAALEAFESAEVVLAYAPQEGREITFVEKLWKKFPEKKWYFPKVEEDEMKFCLVERWEDLVEGKYGIKQPSDQATKLPSSVTSMLILVPAVAVDYQKNRLGRGGGYYDQFLATSSMQHATCTTVCVVPDFALVEEIPVEAHDQAVDKVITISI